MKKRKRQRRKRRIFSNLQPETYFSISRLVSGGVYSAKTIYRFIKTGQLKASKPRGKYLIKSSDWEAFINGKVL